MLYVMRYTVGEGLFGGGEFFTALLVLLAFVMLSHEIAHLMVPLLALSGIAFLIGWAALLPYRHVYGPAVFLASPLDVSVLMYAAGVLILAYTFFKIGRCFGI